MSVTTVYECDVCHQRGNALNAGAYKVDVWWNGIIEISDYIRSNGIIGNPVENGAGLDMCEACAKRVTQAIKQAVCYAVVPPYAK